MKHSAWVIVLVFMPIVLFAQGRRGLSFSGGITSDINYAFSASYFHNVGIKHIYFDGGFRFIGNGAMHSSGDIVGSTNVNQAFAGIRVGDYLFAEPKISYNWYTDHNMIGWGFTGGMLAHPNDRFSLGLSVGYDEGGSNNSLYSGNKQLQITTISLIVNVNMSN
jgi:hypothetical protein